MLAMNSLSQDSTNKVGLGQLILDYFPEYHQYQLLSECQQTVIDCFVYQVSYVCANKLVGKRF